MKYQVFSANDWVYPDTELTKENEAKLYSPRNADVCMQILTDKQLNGGETFSASVDGIPVSPVIYQLKRAHVGKNSGVQYETAKDFNDVKDFVTREAPFDVYDVTLDIKDNKLIKERAAFFVRFNVPKTADTGLFEGKLTLSIDGDEVIIPVSLKIYNAVVPDTNESEFHSVNWLYYDGPYSKWQSYHGVTEWSEEYYALLEKYIVSERDVRTDILMLPPVIPVRDENGKIVDFDFTHAKRVAEIALKAGMRYVAGRFCIEWKQWDAREIYIAWDMDTDCTSVEGYRQLKLYFEKTKQFIKENNLEDKYWQCLCDEPQFTNCEAYRSVGAVCRKYLPDITVFDAVETTKLGGALDIWVVKQATFEKFLDDYKALQEMGEKMWLYTCGYPAGNYMNHVLDLPLTATRLIIWMCYKYNAPGFLHFGYHLHNDETWDETCLRASNGRNFPSGNGFIVYPLGNGVQYSVRAHAQRGGILDFEILNQLSKTDKAKADAITDNLCRTFTDYETSGEALDNARFEILEALG